MSKKACPKKKRSAKNLKKEIVYLCSCCSLVLVLFLASFNVNAFLLNSKVLGAKTENAKALVDEEKYWEDFLALHPTYLDGWIELSKIEYGKGNINYALGAFNTAKAINPNSPKIKELANLLLK